MRVNVYDFMLGIAGVSATLIGTFIVGVFFYIDTDMHRRLMATDTADRYLRSGVRWVFVVYALALFTPLALVAFDPIWGALSFIALSAILLLSTVDTGWHMLMQGGSGGSRALLVNQWTSTAAVVVVVALPWIIGGWVPPATAFVPSIVVALAAGFTSTAALIMSQFDATAAMVESEAVADESDVAREV